MVSFSILPLALIERLYDPQRTSDGCRVFSRNCADIGGVVGGVAVSLQSSAGWSRAGQGPQSPKTPVGFPAQSWREQ